MISWESVDQNFAWNDLMTKIDGPSYLQYKEWGNYKKSLGEKVIRLIGKRDGQVVSAVQCFVNVKLRKFGIVWIPGNLNGELSSFGPEFVSFIQKKFKVKWVYVRSFLHREFSNELSSELKNLGWKESSLKMDSGETMVLRLNNSEDELKQGMRKSFRHNLKRYLKRLNNAEVIDNPSIENVRKVYDSMETQKSLSVQYSEKELEFLITEHKDNLIFVESKGSDGIPAAIRACLIHGDRAWDFLAASNLEARSNYATFGLLWELLCKCKERNVHFYDLAGIDKIKNKGVFNFKNGTGAEEFKYLGEWDYGSHSYIVPIVSFLYYLRNKLI